MHRDRCDKAFSLTELLVVLAGLALIVAICVPLVSHIIPIARRTSCAANLHAIGQAYATRKSVEHISSIGKFSTGGWPSTLLPYFGNNLKTLLCTEVVEVTRTIPDVQLFVWGSGGATRADYALDLTGSYPYWLEGNCWDIEPPPGMWKVGEAKLHAGGYHGESLGLTGFSGGQDNTMNLPKYKPGPNPDVYWYVIETARYGEDLHAGGDLDYDDIVVRVTVNHASGRLELQPFRIWDGQVFNFIGPDGTVWPSGTKDLDANRHQSVGDGNNMGPYMFPMRETSYGMSLYANEFPANLTRKILALDYGQEVVNVGSSKMTDWDLYRAPRHMEESNVLFADGAVQSMDPDEIDPDFPDNEAKYWAPDE